jgi:HlyD family secretion protein
MNLRKVILLLLVLTAIAAGVAYQFGLLPTKSESDLVTVHGNIEAVVTELSFKIPGCIVNRYFDEGQEVQEGQVVCELEKNDLEADLAAREAEFKAAQAAYEEAEHGSRPEEIEAARAARKKALEMFNELKAGSRQQEKDAALATTQSAAADQARVKTELDRAMRLSQADRGAIDQEEFERRKAAYEIAAAKYREAEQRWKLVDLGPRDEEIRQAEAAFHQADAQCRLVEKGPRDEEKEQARAKKAQSQAAWRLAQVRRDYATIRFPPSNDGLAHRWFVLSKNAEPREFVSPGTPVITVGDMKNVWLRAYLEEPYLGRVKIGQKARVWTDSRPGKPYEGTVAFISDEAEFTPKNVQTDKERTRLVYRIKINIDNTDLGLKRGMPAVAEIPLDLSSAETVKE